jgi:hypothetical protein
VVHNLLMLPTLLVSGSTSLSLSHPPVCCQSLEDTPPILLTAQSWCLKHHRCPVNICSKNE